MTITQAIIMTATPILFVVIGLAIIYWPTRKESENSNLSGFARNAKSREKKRVDQ